MHAKWSIEQFCEDVRNLIVGSFLRNRDDAELQIDDDLLTILSSLQLLRMVLELESQYSVKIDNRELTPENLGTVEKIARFVASKLNSVAR